MKGRKDDRSVYRRENTVFASRSCSKNEEEEEDEVEVNREVERRVCR
jgi:hypothetical protein